MKARAVALLSWLGLAMWPILLSQPYVMHVAVMAMIMATMALSLNLMLRMGRLSFMHGALMGIGAYSSALLTMRAGLPFPLAFLCAGAISAMVALVTGPIFLRVKGVYFVLLTFALGEVILLIFTEWTSLFGGASGLLGMPTPTLVGYPIDGPMQFYYLALLLAFASYFLASAIYRSKFGAILDSLSEDEGLAESLGVSAHWYRLTTFSISALLAGFAGSVFAHYLAFLVPDAFNFRVSVDMILINMLGGISTPAGPVLGAILLVPIPELLREFADYQVFVYGLLLILLPIFLPEGLIKWLQKKMFR